MDKTQYNFPEGTSYKEVDNDGNVMYTLTFKSLEVVESLTGERPKFSFSISNNDFDVAAESMKQNFINNGYNFVTNLWQ